MQTPSGKETILIVEDDSDVRNMTTKILKRLGYRVMEAESGSEAYSICSSLEQNLDLILTDVVMPNMSGVQLVKMIKENIWPEVKVIYMSGYAAESRMHKDIDSQGLPYLQKPFSPKILADKVRGVIDQSSG